MWFWIGVGLGSFVFASLLIAFAFARVLGALNGEVIGLLEDRVPASPGAHVTPPKARTSGGIHRLRRLLL